MALTLPRLNFSLPFWSRLSRPGRGGGAPLALGIDIGSHAIKVCELQQNPDGHHRLLTVGSVLTPPDAIEDGGLVDADAVAAVLSPLLLNLKSKKRQVAISVSGHSVIVKKINLPVMSSDDLQQHIISEAEQYIPFDIDDAYLDFQDLQTNREGEDHSDVMLVAASKELVNGYLEMLEGMGLRAAVVDVDAFALENAVDTALRQDENVALVDIGAAKMNINLLSGGSSALTRDVMLGGQELTSQLQRALDLSFAEAEALKIGQAPASPEQQATAAAVVLDICRQWGEEIKRAIDFYLTTNEEQPISRIIVSGGSARLTGLAEFLGHQCELPCSVFNPFADLAFDRNQFDAAYLQAVAPEIAQAFGLATRKAEI